MATQSRPTTPPTTSFSLEGELEDSSIEQHSKEPDYSSEGMSLLPIVDVSDDFDKDTPSSSLDSHRRTLSLPPGTTPNIQSMLRKVYPSSQHHIGNISQENAQPLRRNPIRLA